ncbi:MAG: ABC transporter permease, partial [Gemmatimonadetes bacterium]|nr:ABC transporter permease [Gemmatimonadota bacterium]
MEQIVTEIRHAARRLRRSPGFTAIVVLTLALGIGANSAIFSIVNGVLLRPLPYADPGALVSVTHLYPSLDGLEPGLAAPTFRDLTEESRSFESIAVRAGWMPNLIGEGEPERVTGSRVNGAFFNTYGVPAALGRSILPSDAEGDGARVVVLGHGLWRRVFGEDSGVIGRSILLSGESYEVVGVMPPAFRDFFAPAAEMWSPLTITAQQLSDNGRTNEFLLMSARLRPGVSVGQAEQEMAAVGLRLRTDFPASYPADWSLRLHTLDHLATSEIRPALMILLAAVAFVLLIACANVASLLLARASARRKEIAIRGAMGARRADLVRQLLVEGVVLASMGAALGLFLASSALSLLRATNPLDLPRVEDISIDATVLLFTMSLAVVTGILFGLVPALQLAGTDLQSTLREGGRGSSDRRGATVRRGLVVAEIALALALLIGAGLLIRSFTTLQRVDPGFNPEGVAVMTVPLPVTKFETPEARFAFHEELAERLRGLPGVTAVGRTSKLPFTEGMSTRSFIVEGMELTDGEPAPWGDFRVVDHEYREALQIPLIRGRFFTAADRRDAPGVA